MSDRDIAEETLAHLRHLDDLLTDVKPLLGQFRVSGLLAIRRAAKTASET